MNIKLLFNRMLIALCAIKNNFFNKVQKKYGDEKTVMIVFQQLFGDAIILSNSLKGYIELFPKEKGYKVILLGRPSVVKFMKDVLPIPEDIEINAVDFKKFVESYSYYKEILNKYCHKAGIIIVPGTSLSGEIFSTVCKAKKRVGLAKNIPVKYPPTMALFQKLAYTETLYPEKDLMMLQRHRLLLNYLGLNSYEAKLPNLLYQKRIVNHKNYCVVCPGASVMEKCWSIERFVEVIDYVIEKYNFKVHLCGGNDEIKFEKAILDTVKSPNNVYGHIGKTTFSEWSSIVQYADLVIGNDSATLHLAAASRRKSICITGVYDKFQFFPYKVDKLDKGDVLPVSILKDMPCEWCRTRGYYSGYQNDKCKKEIDRNKCALCIKEITTKEVKKKIDDLLYSNIGV
jgi:ADP-heptose:LPS heptosyltransferase